MPLAPIMCQIKYMKRVHMIESERVKQLNTNKKTTADFVIYWMQQSQRTSYNHALEYAIRKANEEDKPLLVYFGITDDFPDANKRHYSFMIEGLQDIKENLTQKNINFIVRVEHPVEGIVTLSQDAALIVVDCGYLGIQQEWREKVSNRIDCPLIQVESDVIVPVETSSDKEEYAAYTLRPKLQRNLSQFLTSLNDTRVKYNSLDYDFSSNDISSINSIISKLNINTSVQPVPFFKGGEEQAKKVLDYFIKNHIKWYDEKRNDPAEQVTSQLSPYLHFGHISPLLVALEIRKNAPEFSESFLEELIVRRELSMNFVYYNESYNEVSCLPNWAFETLQKHEEDKREYVYSFEEMEKASTHDPYWNAAQNEMRYSGKMHGYMRMYWGKKILEWSDTITDAFNHALLLNNTYELDGRDPNGFAGVAWCFGKHDRAWKERPIFGKVRYMSQAGLKRKGHLEEYVDNVEKKLLNDGK